MQPSPQSHFRTFPSLPAILSCSFTVNPTLTLSTRQLPGFFFYIFAWKGETYENSSVGPVPHFQLWLNDTRQGSECKSILGLTFPCHSVTWIFKTRAGVVGRIILPPPKTFTNCKCITWPGEFRLVISWPWDQKIVLYYLDVSSDIIGFLKVKDGGRIVSDVT